VLFDTDEMAAWPELNLTIPEMPQLIRAENGTVVGHMNSSHLWGAGGQVVGEVGEEGVIQVAGLDWGKVQRWSNGTMVLNTSTPGGAEVFGRIEERFLEGMNMTLKCSHHQFIVDGVSLDTFLELSDFCSPVQEHQYTEALNDTTYVSTCLPSGEWDAVVPCSLRFCGPLSVDDATVTLTDLTTTYFSDNITKTVGYNVDGNSGTTGYDVGTLYTAECTQFGDDFDFGENIIRTLYYCNKTGWAVSEETACPGGSPCTQPTALSCTFRGCGPLPAIPSAKEATLSYLGTQGRSLKGGTTSLVCGQGDEPRLPVVLASLASPGAVLALDLAVEVAGTPSQAPDWCPHASCFAAGDTMFTVDDQEEDFQNCFKDGYLSGKLIQAMYNDKPKCARAATLYFNESKGYVWESGGMSELEDCVASAGGECDSRIPKGCPVSACLSAGLPWMDPGLPGLVHYGCSYASGAQPFGKTTLHCPKKSGVDIVEDKIHVDSASGMEECDELDDLTQPCLNPVPTVMAKTKAAKRNKEKSHKFKLTECADGFTFNALDNKSLVTTDLYLAFDGSHLVDSYPLLRLYELEALPDESKACLRVLPGLCGPNTVSLSPPGHQELLLTDCQPKLHFRRENDFCGSKLSQCWQPDFDELPEEQQEDKFLVSPLEGRLLADTEEELAEQMEQRLREKGLEEASAFSAPSVLRVTCQGNDEWAFEDPALADASVLTDLIKIPCLSTHTCVAPPSIFIADPPLETKAELTVTTPGQMVSYACPPDFLFDDKKLFPADVDGVCTNKTIFEQNFPYWIIPGLSYPTVTDMKCLNTKICPDIPNVSF
jgi:hypothetical protein